MAEKKPEKKAAQKMGQRTGTDGGMFERLRSTRAAEALDLRRRVRRLEAEVQECRALNIRLAELTDIGTELLLPVAARDEEKLAVLLEKYRQSV
jgi:hypothetical protein